MTKNERWSGSRKKNVKIDVEFCHSVAIEASRQQQYAEEEKV